MRSFLLGAVAAIGLCPTVASAVVQLNVERVDVVPTGAQQIVYLDVFGDDLAPEENERLSGYTIGIAAPTFTDSGVRFNIPDDATTLDRPSAAHPYVFAAFPGVEPERAFSDFQTVFALGAIAGSGDANISPTLNGFFRLPVLIPANAGPGFFPVVIEPQPTTALAGNAGAVPFAVGPGGGVNIVPEPASLGLIVLGGLLTLRRRRVA